MLCETVTAQGTLYYYSMVKFGAVSLGEVGLGQSRLGFIDFLLSQNCLQERTQEWQPTAAWGDCYHTVLEPPGH